ncbi:MAG: hypothetical protein RJA70_2618 [Pseudomonadota bacterium]|jgi:hypothetical protein
MRSKDTWFRLLAAAQLMVAPQLTLGCGVDAGGPVAPEDAAAGRVYDVEIDTGAGIEVEGGQGAGVFLQYSSGGEWELFTTCDTLLSGLLCEYDIVLSVPVGARLGSPRGLELERGDQVVEQRDGVLRLLWLTGDDFDRVTFETDEGETLRLDALIDGVPDPELIFWNGYDALQQAAPSNPLDLTPSEL